MPKPVPNRPVSRFFAAAALLALAATVPGAFSGPAQDLPEEPFARGKALLLRGNNAEARAAFEAVLAADPGHREARYLRGTAGLKLEDADGAWADFAALAEGEFRSPLGRLGFAQVYMKRGQFPEAETEIVASLAENPDSAEAHFQRGLLLGHLQRAQEAAAEFERSLELDPALAYAHYHGALAYNQLRRMDLAVVHLEKFLADAPLAPEAGQVRALLNAIRR